MAASDWIKGPGGIIAPVQAEAVVITTNDSYAIMETLDDVRAQLADVPADAKVVFVTITPKEGGKALLNINHVVGFVENETTPQLQ